MASTGFWATAAKIAWREARASSAKFLFVSAAVAIGVGSLTGVRGFSQAFKSMLLKEARTLMAADLTVRTFALASPDQVKAMDTIVNAGGARTEVTETLSMLAGKAGGTPLLVSIKAVDPNVYPFYGELKLSPYKPLREMLQTDTCAVSEDLLARLELKLGDSITAGAGSYRIVATVASEPDRMTGTLNVGPRVLLSRPALDRTGLIVTGSRAAQRFLFRLPAGADVEKTRADLKKAFPDAQIVDYRETHPLITQGLNRSTTFLSLVSLIALIVGALGVAMAMHSHLQQKLDTIAVMKSMGARSGQILRIYVIETLLMGLAGGTGGVLLGLAAQRIFPQLLARYFQIDPGLKWDPASALQGLAIGILTTVLFTVPPLLNIRRVKPSLILRRDMLEVRPGWTARLRQSLGSALAGGGAVAGIAGVAWWLSDSTRTALYFAGGFAVSLLVLGGIAEGLLRSLRNAWNRLPIRLSPVTRQGVANVYRPGNQAAALLVALGLGVTFTLTVYLVQRSMLAQIQSSAPPGMPNVFLINITPKEQAGVQEILNRYMEKGGEKELVPLVAVRILTIDGKPVKELGLKGFNRRFEQTRSVTYSDKLPAQASVVQGKWWPANAPAEPAQISISEDTQRALNLKPGAVIEWQAGARHLTARVAAVHHSEAVRLGSNLEFIFNSGSLEGLPRLYFGAVRMKPADVPRLQAESYKQYPTVTVINGADVLAIVQEVVDQIALVIRFVSGFAILGGMVILTSSVAGTRFRRIREVVILKTLGATRGKIAAIFSVEFVVLGAVAGALGSLLASAFSWVVLERLFRVHYRLDVVPLLVCIVVTAGIANAAGWLASFRILGQKPLEVLRGE